MIAFLQISSFTATVRARSGPQRTFAQRPQCGCVRVRVCTCRSLFLLFVFLLLFVRGESATAAVVWEKWRSPTDASPTVVVKFVFHIAWQLIVFSSWHLSLFLNPRWHWQLLLWPGSSHEAPPHTYDPQPAAQLWAISQNGDLRKLLFYIGAKLVEFFENILYSTCFYKFYLTLKP